MRRERKGLKQRGAGTGGQPESTLGSYLFVSTIHRLVSQIPNCLLMWVLNVNQSCNLSMHREYNQKPTRSDRYLTVISEVSVQPTKESRNLKEHGAFYKLRKEWIEPILIAVILVTVIKTFLFQNFKIPSGSMEDTLLVGDYLFATKFLYGTKVPFTNKVIWKIRDPKPGDIVVFRSVEEPKDLIKRVIAVGGQTVEIRDTKIFVDGVEQKLPETGKIIDPIVIPAGVSTRDNLGPITVPDGNLFMMGDNRDNSYDSRFWGFLPVENVKGKAMFLYWSWNSEVPLFDIVHSVRWNRILDPIR